MGAECVAADVLASQMPISTVHATRGVGNNSGTVTPCQAAMSDVRFVSTPILSAVSVANSPKADGSGVCEFGTQTPKNGYPVIPDVSPSRSPCHGQASIGLRNPVAPPSPALIVNPVADSGPSTTARRGSSASGQAVTRRSQRVSSVVSSTGAGGASQSHPVAASGRTGGGASTSAPRNSKTLKRSKSMPAADKNHEEQGAKNNQATPALRRARTSAHSGSSNVPKATTTVSAGKGAVATQAKKKGNQPKKMVLPFSYAVEDPRHYHIESAGAEGRICPEFLPP